MPNIFTTGDIIPVIKKSTLDPNVVKNYRPISSVHTKYTKAIESFIIPSAEISDNQFGFVRAEEPHSHVIYSIMSHLIANPVVAHCF